MFPKNPHIKIFLKKNTIHSNKIFSNILFQNEPKKEGEKTSENSKDNDTIGFWLNSINSSNMYRSLLKAKILGQSHQAAESS